MQGKPIEIKKFQRKPSRGLAYCHSCGDYATSEALFEVDNYIVSRRYCEECLQAGQFDI